MLKYFKERKREKETEKILKDAAKKFPGDKDLFVNYYIAINKANQVTNEEAIENYKKEKQEYEKSKAVEEKVLPLLKKYDLIAPPVFQTLDFGLKQAMYILDVKGMEIPDLKHLENPQITSEELIAGLNYAAFTIRLQMEYFEASENDIKKIAEIFDNIINNEVVKAN